MTPPQYSLRITCDRPQLEVRGMMWGEEYEHPEGGIGGWVATRRVRRSPIVEWHGPSDAETAPLTIRLARDLTGSVDAALKRLERMSRMPSENVAPPTIRVHGLTPLAGRRWAIEDYELSDVERDESGSFESVVVTFELILVENTGDGVTVAKRVPATMRSKKNDTWQKIALRYYGSTRHAAALRKAQSVRLKRLYRDVRKKIKPGTVVRLP